MAPVSDPCAAVVRLLRSPAMAATVRIVGNAQHVRIVAGSDEVRVDGTASVQREADVITVTAHERGITVHVPDGTDLVVGSSSGRIATVGTLGAVSITCESGRVDVDRASSVDVRAESGRITVGRVAEICRVRSRSGRVVVQSCGAADVSTRSGRIALRSATGDVVAHSVSGRIEVGLSGPHDVDAETVSGRIEITVPAGTRTFQPAPGDAAVPADPDCCTVRASSTSGRVVLRSA